MGLSWCVGASNWGSYRLVCEGQPPSARFKLLHALTGVGTGVGRPESARASLVNRLSAVGSAPALAAHDEN